MTSLSRRLTVWVLLMSLFLIAIISAHRIGNWWARRVDEQTLYSQGKELLAATEHDEAIACFSKAVEIAPDFVDARIMLIDALRRVGKLAEARAHCEKIVEDTKGEDQIRALFLMSEIARELALFDDAEHALKDILELLPNSAQAHYALAQIAEDTARYAEMVVLLKSAVNLDRQDSSEEYVALREEYRKVAHDLSSRKANGERTAWLQYQLGIAYKGMGDWSKAIEAFTASSEQTDTPADAFFWLGVDAEINGDFPLASGHYRSAVTILPSHRKALLGLRRCLNKQEPHPAKAHVSF